MIARWPLQVVHFALAPVREMHRCGHHRLGDLNHSNRAPSITKPVVEVRITRMLSLNDAMDLVQTEQRRRG